jgi:hypothetical protein
MTKNKPNKFDELSRAELLQRVLVQEDELERLRPKPPKFKLGQLVAYWDPKAPTANFKHPWMPGQPAVYFTILSMELKNEGWFYGHSRTNAQSQPAFSLYPEKKCRALLPTELDGSNALEAQETDVLGQVGAMQAQAPALIDPIPYVIVGGQS